MQMKGLSHEVVSVIPAKYLLGESTCAPFQTRLEKVPNAPVEYIGFSQNKSKIRDIPGKNVSVES